MMDASDGQRRGPWTENVGWIISVGYTTHDDEKEERGAGLEDGGAW